MQTLVVSLVQVGMVGSGRLVVWQELPKRWLEWGLDLLLRLAISSKALLEDTGTRMGRCMMRNLIRSLVSARYPIGNLGGEAHLVKRNVEGAPVLPRRAASRKAKEI